MANRPPSPVASFAQGPTSAGSPKQSGLKLMGGLTAAMSLLSLLVFGLGCLRKDVLWLWIGFICALISGVFVQLFIDRNKNNDSS